MRIVEIGRLGLNYSGPAYYNAFVIEGKLAAQIVDRLDKLTSREWEILRALGSGTTNKELALELDVSHRTVEASRARILKKLGAKNIVQAVAAIAHIETQRSNPKVA